jgi:hypothetical protein
MSSNPNVEVLGFDATLKEVSKVGQFTLVRIEPTPPPVAKPSQSLKKKSSKKNVNFM